MTQTPPSTEQLTGSIRLVPLPLDTSVGTPRAVWATDARLRALVDHAPDPVVVLDALGALLYANPASTVVLGLPVDAWVGRSMLDLVHPDDRGLAAEALGSTVAGGPGVKEPLPVRVGSPDGTWRRLELAANNLLDDPAVGGIVLTARDVTERASIEASLSELRRRFEIAFEHAPVARALLTLDGRIARANRQASVLTGYTPEQLVQLGIDDLAAAPDELDEDREMLRRLLSGQRDHHDAVRRLRRADGTIRWVHRIASIVWGDDGTPQHVALDVTDVTDIRRAEAIRRQAEAEFRALVDHSTEIITVLEPDGTWRSSSAAGSRLLGYPPGHDAGPLGIFSLLHPDDVKPAQRALAEVVDGTRGPDDAVVLRVRAADGRWHHLETRARSLVDDSAVRGILVTSRDVTQRLSAERRLARLYDVLEASNDIVILSDESGRVIYANRIARSLFGLADGDDPRGELERLLVPESIELCRREVMPELDEHGVWTGELTFRTRTGATIPVAATLQFHPDEGDELVFVSTIAHDISELKTTQQLLEHQATHDPLTGLPNRTLFQELGEQALARANRDGTTIAVLFLDLDRFKSVNDTLGHVAGDELLAQAAARLRAAVRAGDVLARFGGDEFVILCEHPAGAPEMLELAGRLVEVSSAPARVSGTEVATGASIGIAIGGGSRVTIDALLREADAALLLAKEEGRGRAKLFGAPVA